MAKRVFLAVLFAFSSHGVVAFQLPYHAGASARTVPAPRGAPRAGKGGNAATETTTTSLGMAPRFDKDTQKWFATSDEELPSAGYNILGSLYRAGPVPAFQRIVNPADYEQGVLKFMAKEGCDRIEAQGNMDAFLENPNDWAFQKLEEKKGAPKKDYANANMEPKQIILSTLWACIVVAFAYDTVTGVAEGRYGKVQEGVDLFHGNLFSLPF